MPPPSQRPGSTLQTLPDNALVPLADLQDASNAGMFGRYVAALADAASSDKVGPLPADASCPQPSLSGPETTSAQGPSALAQMYFRVHGLQSALVGPLPLLIHDREGAAAAAAAASSVVFPLLKTVRHLQKNALLPTSTQLQPPFALVLQRGLDVPASVSQGRGSCMALRSNVRLVNGSTMDILVALVGTFETLWGHSPSPGPESTRSIYRHTGGCSGGAPSDATLGSVLHLRNLQQLQPGGHMWLPASLLRGGSSGASSSSSSSAQLSVRLMHPSQPWQRQMEAKAAAGPAVEEPAWSQLVNVGEFAAMHSAAAALSGSGHAFGSARALLRCSQASSTAGPSSRDSPSSDCLLLEAEPTPDGCCWELTMRPPVVLRNHLPVPLQLSLVAEHLGMTRCGRYGTEIAYTDIPVYQCWSGLLIHFIALIMPQRTAFLSECCSLLLNAGSACSHCRR